jgi:hypothetical protein
MTDLWIQNILPFQFLQFWTKSRLLHLLCSNFAMQSRIAHRKQLNYSSIYDKWAIMKLVSPNIYILCNFLILFHVYVVQFGITFDMLV